MMRFEMTCEIYLKDTAIAAISTKKSRLEGKLNAKIPVLRMPGYGP